MKILIKNFGPIHEFEFDLEKDLHMIYGENSIGKSYISYVVYLIIKKYHNFSRKKYLLFIGDSFMIREELAVILADKKDKVDITSFIEVACLKVIRTGFVDELQNSLKNTFGNITSLNNSYTSNNFTFCITDDKYGLKIYIHYDNNKIAVEKIDITKRFLLIEKNKVSGTYIISSDNIEQSEVLSDVDEIVSKLYLIFRNCIESLVRNIEEYHFLPCSRSGLYQGLSAFTPIIAELSQNRAFLKNQQISLPTLSEPIADYFLDISTIDVSHTHKQLKNIAKKLEQNLLKGTVKYNSKKNKIEYVNTQTKLVLSLSETSSMISELAPLVLFLKYIIGNKDHKVLMNNIAIGGFGNKYTTTKEDSDTYYILFIEEPEAHLHPKIQVQLMEIFAELTKVGVKVVMTTHSNYMFNKLSNMLLKKEIEVAKVGSYHLVMTEKGSVVNTDMQATEEGMEDHNFVDTAEQLYNERLLAYETLNENAN